MELLALLAVGKLEFFTSAIVVICFRRNLCEGKAMASVKLFFSCSKMLIGTSASSEDHF
jgi:hypothetical protein